MHEDHLISKKMWLARTFQVFYTRATPGMSFKKRRDPYDQIFDIQFFNIFAQYSSSSVDILPNRNQ